MTCTAVYIKQNNISKFAKDFTAAAKQAPALFRKGIFFLELQENVSFNVEELCMLVRVIEDTGAVLIGARAHSLTLQHTCQMAGIRIIYNNKNISKDKPALNKPQNTSGTMMQGRVRSGTQIYAKNKDLVVCGDVSHGSEIIASGNIFVFGVLHGKAIAGADGNEMAEIYAGYFEPELVSIAGVYVVNEDISVSLFGKKVRTHMTHGRIEITAFPGTHPINAL